MAMRSTCLAVCLCVVLAGPAPGGPGGDSVYTAAVAAPTRPAADRERDAGRHPAEVLAFFGVEPGDAVLDLFSGGGYYSELLSHVVGPEGRVVAHTNSPYLNYVGDEFEARHAEGRLPNVEVRLSENDELVFEEAAFDAVVIVLSYHDIYFEDAESGWTSIDRDGLLAELYDSLVPGGIVGIVDHAAAPGAPPETGGTLHRIDPAIVKRDLEAAGFVADGASDVLANPEDDRTISVFDPAVRGKTDRFVLRFRKPR